MVFELGQMNSPVGIDDSTVHARHFATPEGSGNYGARRAIYVSWAGRRTVHKATHSPSRGASENMQLIAQFIRDEDGQDVVEYGLLIATIAIVVLVGISFFGSNINAWFQTLAARITTTGIS